MLCAMRCQYFFYYFINFIYFLQVSKAINYCVKLTNISIIYVTLRDDHADLHQINAASNCGFAA